MTRRRIALPLAAALLLIAAAPTAAAAPSARLRLVNKFAAVGSGPVSGTYFAIATAIAKVMNVRAVAETFFVIPSEGSLENLGLLARGDIQYALCQSDLFTYAVNGDRMFAGGPVKNIRAVLSLYPEAIQIVVRADSGLVRIEDLRGRRVCLGLGRSGTGINAETVLTLHGITRADYKADPSEPALALEKLGDRSVDAVFFTAGLPTAAILEFAALTPIRLLPIAPDRAREIAKAQPFLSPTVVPALTYPGQTAEVSTLGPRALLVTTDAATNGEVTDLLLEIFRSAAFLGAAHPAGRGIDRAHARDGIPADSLHEAARAILK